jgi:hypothetical protein
MAKIIPHKEIGGEGIHVRDCYVWTEISYLDSPSDFREYLPQHRQWKPNDDRLVMSDSPKQSSRFARDLFCGSLINTLAPPARPSTRNVTLSYPTVWASRTPDRP